MGKRKSSKKPAGKKARPKLETAFNCPFCNSSSTVTATLDRDTKHGGVSCSVCGASFETAINPLTEAVDVYSAWIDECEEANQA